MGGLQANGTDCTHARHVRCPLPALTTPVSVGARNCPSRAWDVGPHTCRFWGIILSIQMLHRVDNGGGSLLSTAMWQAGPMGGLLHQQWDGGDGETCWSMGWDMNSSRAGRLVRGIVWNFDIHKKC